jgi:Ca-activated chloride channel family protein
MRRYFPILPLLALWAGAAHASGVLVPVDRSLPPLALVSNKVQISIQEEVSTTRVEQTFRNHTDRQLEATYIFPVPRGASVDRFTMWVGGSEVKGELVEAAKARDIYTSIVRRTQDPGLLEYLGNNLLRLRVFPVPAHGEQKVSLSYTAKAERDGKVIEYVYPVKSDNKALATPPDFSLHATIQSQHGIQNVYSPTHPIALKRTSSHEVMVQLDSKQALLDKDFQLFYSLDDKDVGLTTLTQRPVAGEKGYFMLLISPKVELAQSYQVPRDVVLLLDTSGSMRGIKMDQARKALKYCLKNLTEKDRFGLITFATTVNRYRDGLTEARPEQITQAEKWVDTLEATGGTAINDALLAALDLRTSDSSRTFTIVFFTDGQPTIGETNPDRILRNAAAKNSANTRIFTFGVGFGDNINASMLDQLAEQSRAVSTYVRPEEDIEAKVSSLYSKISHPVLANLKLSVTQDIGFTEIYPPQLPDLFHDGQLVVLGRYSGSGPAAVHLTGTLGTERREFVYETTFAAQTTQDRGFVEHLWARRKVGYMLDQIRLHGEKKELVDEIILLAKKYGITTPYTSYLIVPDGPVALAPGGFGGGAGRGGLVPRALLPATPAGAPLSVTEFAQRVQDKPGDLGKNRGLLQDEELGKAAEGAAAAKDAREKKAVYDQALFFLKTNSYSATQAGQLGVELSMQTNNLRNQSCLEQTAVRRVTGRNCMEIGGVWIDEGFNAQMKVVTIKAQSDAYFRLLERRPEMRPVLQLGNHVLWVTPSRTALVIDTQAGAEKLADAEIDRLFTASK